MQISPWALNYTDYITIISGAIKGFSKPTSVLKGSVRERLLYRRKSALVCMHHAHGGACRLPALAARLGSSLTKKKQGSPGCSLCRGWQAATPALATLPASLCPRRSQACNSTSHRSRADGLHRLGSACPEIPGSQGIARTTGHPQRLSQLPGRAFPKDIQRGGRMTRSRGMCYSRKAPHHTRSPNAPCNLC